jgi:hypothetical protein
MGFSYIGIVALVGYWIWLRKRAAQEAGSAVVSEAKPQSVKRTRVVAWVTVGALGVLIFCLWDMNFKIQNMSTSEIQNIVQKTDAGELSAHVLQVHPYSLFKNAPSWMKFVWVEVHHNGTVTRYSSNFDEATVAMITAKGVECRTYVQGRDFEILGTPGRLLPFISAFVVGIGAVYLIRTRCFKRRAV